MSSKEIARSENLPQKDVAAGFSLRQHRLKTWATKKDSWRAVPTLREVLEFQE